MDTFFLGDHDFERRVFRRILDNASDPGLKGPQGDRVSVVERVAEKPGYRHTRAAYESRLWDLLGPRIWTPIEREEEISRLLRDFALYESGPEDKAILDALIQPDFRGLSRSRSYFRRTLRQLARKRDLDRILLLCLLYRRYFEAGRLGEARDVRHAVLQAIRHFCNRPGFHGDVHTLWVFITRRCIFAGQPSLEHTWQALYEAREMLAGWEVRCIEAKSQKWFDNQVWLYACLRENAEEIPVSYLIPRTLAVERFLSARDQLMIKALDAAVLAWHPPELDQPISAAIRFAELQGHRE